MILDNVATFWCLVIFSYVKSHMRVQNVVSQQSVLLAKRVIKSKKFASCFFNTVINLSSLCFIVTERIEKMIASQGSKIYCKTTA